MEELQVLPYLQALSLLWLYWDWGMFASLLQGKKGCGCSCCYAHSTAQVAAWSLGSGHAQVWVHISRAREGPILDPFGFIPVTPFSWFFLSSLSVYYLFDKVFMKPCFVTAPVNLCISPFLVKQVNSAEGAALNHYIMRRCFLPARYETTCSPI